MGRQGLTQVKVIVERRSYCESKTLLICFEEKIIMDVNSGDRIVEGLLYYSKI